MRGITALSEFREKIMDKVNKFVSSICIGLLLISNPSFASYHTDEAGNSDGDSGGGYGGGGGALALIAVYAVGYVIYKNTRDEDADEESTYMFSKRTEPGFEVSLSTQKNSYQSYLDQEASGFRINDSNPQTSLNVYYRFK